MVTAYRRSKVAMLAQPEREESPWVMLGLPRGADKTEIRRRFRKLASTQHPDVKRADPEAGSKFARLTRAYEDLMELQALGTRRSKPAPQHTDTSRWTEDMDRAALNMRDRLGRTTLHMAAAAGDARGCLAILACRDFVEVDARDVQGATALHFIAKRCLAEACAALLAREDFTEVNAKDKQGKTALHWAAAAGCPDVCGQILLHRSFTEAGAEDYLGRSARDFARQVGHEECQRILGMLRLRAGDK